MISDYERGKRRLTHDKAKRIKTIKSRTYFASTTSGIITHSNGLFSVGRYQSRFLKIDTVPAHHGSNDTSLHITYYNCHIIGVTSTRVAGFFNFRVRIVGFPSLLKKARAGCRAFFRWEGNVMVCSAFSTRMTGQLFSCLLSQHSADPQKSDAEKDHGGGFGGGVMH